MLSGTTWGADSSTLLSLYRSLIRSKIDYGCQVYISARNSYIMTLETIQNSSLRLTPGAFRTSPVNSLNCLARIPSLNNRRQILLLKFSTRLWCQPGKHLHDSYFHYPLTIQHYTNSSMSVPPNIIF